MDVKGTGGGYVCVWAFVVALSQTGFLVEKNRLPPYHVETRTAFQPAEQPTHSFIWINLTLLGSLPANSALRALSVFLSLRSTLCSWPKLKNVFTLHWLKMNGGVHKHFTLSNLSHSHFFLSNLDTSYIGAVPKPAGTGRNRCFMERDARPQKSVSSPRTP